jgi:hypothetical protein
LMLQASLKHRKIINLKNLPNKLHKASYFYIFVSARTLFQVQLQIHEDDTNTNKKLHPLSLRIVIKELKINEVRLDTEMTALKIVEWQTGRLYQN